MTTRSAISAIIVSHVLLGGTAGAGPSGPSWIEDTVATGPSFLRQIVPATTAAVGGLAVSRTIFLNRHDTTLRPGTNDSRTNTSSVVSRLTLVPAWTPSDADWATVVACMTEIWSRFDVVVTDVDPGATPHIEALFARSPADLGITSYIGGISPFTQSCTVIDNSIVFAFTDNLPHWPRSICEVMAQEVAHSYGLDHELLAADPMTYLSYTGPREFQDQDASCGETKARPCGMSGASCRATQNSVQLLLARVGAAGRDDVPPSLGITAPGDSETVDSGFAITATATDNVAVKTVAFYLDGQLIETQTEPPYQLQVTPTLADGVHTIAVEATDDNGNTAMQERDITVTGTGDGFGCSAGGSAPSAWLVVAIAAMARRRRGRRLARDDRGHRRRRHPRGFGRDRDGLHRVG